MSPFIQTLKIIKYPISIFRFFRQQGSEQVNRVLTFIHFNKKKREMGLGLNLGIPDPRQWKKQQVSKAVIDEERVSHQ